MIKGTPHDDVIFGPYKCHRQLILLTPLLSLGCLCVHEFVGRLHVESETTLISFLPRQTYVHLTKTIATPDGSLLVLVACRHSKEHSFNTALTLMEINNGVRSLEFVNLPDQVVLLQLNLILI